MSSISETIESTTTCNVTQEPLGSKGSTNLIVLDQSDGTYLVGDGDQIFTLESGEIVSTPLEYTNVILDESAIELISESVQIEQNANDFNKVSEDSLKTLINEIQLNLTSGLNNINKKMRSINTRYRNLEQEVDSMVINFKSSKLVSRVAFPLTEKKSGSIIVGVDPSTCALKPSKSKNKQKLKTKNSEPVPNNDKLIDSYPDGSWLGDPNAEARRVRCPIKEPDLKQLKLTCLTAEKMALSLLDYLFDRETQASSNISGTSKHGKKQLDPVKIFGIRCHLEYLFNVSMKDWQRIKQNIDSKCRTAFRRKAKGMPLKVKFPRANPCVSRKKCNEDAEALKSISVKEIENQEVDFKNSIIESGEVAAANNVQHEMNYYSCGNSIPISLHTTDGLTFSLPTETIEPESQMIHVHTEDGRIEIIHATTEQLTQFQLAGAQILEQFENHIVEETILHS